MLLLLDLDGTLIHDHGYRAAIDKTVLRYAQVNGLPQYAPSDEEVHVLHAHGYSNEWDSVAFLASILHYSKSTGSAERPNYLQWIGRTAGLPGLPNERARDVLLQSAPADLQATIHRLLDHVTDVENCPTTRLFAEMILGSELFTQHYGLPAILHSTSLLEALDEPLITQRSHEIILANRSCIFTARPSLPPGHRTGMDHDDVGDELVHPPEAEIGLKLLHLEHLPMIALGHVQWLADQFHERVYDLTKPSPVQALAAFLAAKEFNEHTSLLSAYQLWKYGRFSPDYEALEHEHIYVFEDNAGGVRACHDAAELLHEHGILVKVHGMGIAVAQAKRAALQPYCDWLFDDVNQALAQLSEL